MVATRSNKRQRQSFTTVTQITDFPDVVLSSISSYLTQTSTLKLCLAITSKQPDSSISKAVMAQHYHLWDSIDFNDMKELFGGVITDDNIRWVLLCTDAVHNLKSLKLTNCLGITGVGLQPLVGSKVLEIIDLSLVGANESPTINPEPPISAEIVVPILESIIDTEGNELVQVIMPKKWRVEKSDILTNFLRKFGRVLVDREIDCCGYNCGEICGATRTRSGAGSSLVCSDVTNVNQYGLVTFACSGCNDNYCSSCQDENRFCEVCEKFFCDDCADMNWCDGEDCNSNGSFPCRACAPDALAQW